MASDTASELLSPPPDARAAEGRAQRARTVSADLEAIFGQTRATVVEPRARRMTPGARRGPDAPPRRLSAASLGGLAAAALAGVAAGALLMKPIDRTQPPPKAHPAALPVEMVPPLQTPQAADAALAAAVLVPMTPAPAVRTASAPKPAAARRAHSSYAQVQAADRRLRAAYEAAIRAGAPRAVLVSSRDRWAQIRRRAAHDPERLIAGYGDLARDLDRDAARNRGGPVQVSERHSRWKPRFRAWW